MAITQTITTIPDAGHRGVDARETFVTKQEAFQDALTDTFVTEINTFRTQANDLETNVNAKEASAVIARNEAVQARDEAVGAVATLPDGIINDGTVSETDTWSSEKIDNSLDLKANTSNPTITGLKETSVAMGANNIDLSLGNYFTKTITGATTLTVSNVPASGTVGYFLLKLTNGGAGAVTYPSGTKWSKGTAPTLTASGIDLLRFVTIDGGVRFEASRIQEDSK